MKVDIKDLETIFARGLGEKVTITIDTKREDIEQWDSINQLNLIIELEDFYKISLTRSEIEKLNSIKYLIEVIESK